LASVWHDKQLDNFLQLKGEFENSHIDTKNSGDDDKKETVLNQISEDLDEHEAELEILQLKDNVIRRGLVQLE